VCVYNELETLRNRILTIQPVYPTDLFSDVLQLVKLYSIFILELGSFSSSLLHLLLRETFMPIN